MITDLKPVREIVACNKIFILPCRLVASNKVAQLSCIVWTSREKAIDLLLNLCFSAVIY